MKNKFLFLNFAEKIVKNLLICLAIFVFFATTYAQFRAVLLGEVKDENGNRLSGVSIILNNYETGNTQIITTNENGFFGFSALAPGSYNLTAEMQNFKKTTVKINVRAETTQEINIILEFKKSDEIDTTSDQYNGLEIENVGVRSQISKKEILSLPQLGRDINELDRTAPGILSPGMRGGNGNSLSFPNGAGPGGSNNSIFQSENQQSVSVAGQRISTNNFLIDGVSVNSLVYGGASVITPNQEAVKEVNISGSRFSAEVGRNSGAQIQIVSENGTNQFRGSTFFKYNDPTLNAFNKFNGIPGRTPVPAQRAENRDRNFGGLLGGAIIKNRLFFFGSYEGLRSDSNNLYEAFIETSAFRQQVINMRPVGTTARLFQMVGIEPRIISTVSKMCAEVFGSESVNRCRDVAGGLDLGSIAGTRNIYLPLGNGIGNANIGGGFDGTPDVVYALLDNPNRQRGSQYSFRSDYEMNGKNRFVFSSFITTRKDFSISPGTGSRITGDLVSKPLSYFMTGIWINNLSSKTINELRVNLTRLKFNQTEDSTKTNFGIPSIEIEGLPFDRIRFGVNRSETIPANFSQRTFEIADILTTIFRSHIIRFGGSFRREFDDNELSGGARPNYTFVGLFNLANDTPFTESINADPTTGAPARAMREMRSNDVSFFVQDNWKVRTDLTLNLGLRYEYFSPLTDTKNRLTNLEVGTGTRALIDAKLVSVESLIEPDKNNFAPRIGFAYSPRLSSLFGARLENKIVIRGGAGIYYNRIPDAVFANSNANPPNFMRFFLCCGTVETPFAGGRITYALGSNNTPDSFPINPALAVGINPTTGLPNGGAVEIYGSPRSVPNSEVYKYALSLQYELPYSFFASIGYEGNQSRHLIRTVNQNFLYQNNSSIGAVFFVQPDVTANYNGLNLGIERRFAGNFQISADYRFGKSLDTLSNEGLGAEGNQTYPVDLSQERGASDFDVRHLFNLSGIVKSPFFKNQTTFLGKVLGGFEVSGILTYQTGFPWTPKLDQSIQGLGSDFFNPIRPVRYFGGVQQDTSNSSFLRPNGYFVGGGSRYFQTTLNPGEPTYQNNVPGIGRNSFRSPNYFNLDLSIAKKIKLPNLGFSDGNSNLVLRFNFFNALNTLNLAPFRFFSSGTFVNRPNFGEPDGALAGRRVEIQARFTF